MPPVKKPGAVVQYRCKACGATFETFGALGSHVSQQHRRPRSGERAGGVSRETPAPVVPSGSRRIEDAGGGDPGPVPPDGHTAAGPSPDEPTGGRLRPSRPQLTQPILRMTPELRTESVRDAIRDALPLATLADLLHALSVAVSEADGAGPAGYLSPIQCTQVAVLLYDSTVDLVADRFDGNVGRFKAMMAVVVILASKGTVHARAIRVKLDERRAARYSPPAQPAPEAVDPGANGHAPDVFIPGVPIAPDLAGTYAEAMARQRAMQNEGPTDGG